MPDPVDISTLIGSASDDQTIGAAELASLLGVSRDHVYDMIREGRIPAVDVTRKKRRRRAASSYRPTWKIRIGDYRSFVAGETPRRAESPKPRGRPIKSLLRHVPERIR